MDCKILGLFSGLGCELAQTRPERQAGAPCLHQRMLPRYEEGVGMAATPVLTRFAAESAAPEAIACIDVGGFCQAYKQCFVPTFVNRSF